MARCLRCNAGSEWIEGDVKPEPAGEFRVLDDEEMRAVIAEVKREVGHSPEWYERSAFLKLLELLEK